MGNFVDRQYIYIYVKCHLLLNLMSGVLLAEYVNLAFKFDFI